MNLIEIPDHVSGDLSRSRRVTTLGERGCAEHAQGGQRESSVPSVMTESARYFSHFRSPLFRLYVPAERHAFGSPGALASRVSLYHDSWGRGMNFACVVRRVRT